jgi:hypothetical protein
MACSGVNFTLLFFPDLPLRPIIGCRDFSILGSSSPLFTAYAIVAKLKNYPLDLILLLRSKLQMQTTTKYD